MSRAGRGGDAWSLAGLEPGQLSLASCSSRMERLRQEAREQEQLQAEEKARQAREAQARVQLKEQEVLQLQVGRVSTGWGWRPGAQPARPAESWV